MTQLIIARTLDDALRSLAAEEEKGRTVVFCEDRLTLLAERAVLARKGGSLFTEVTTFARFLSGDRQVLSKQGSVMKIAAIIEKNASRLQCFRKEAAQTVYETIAQLAASRVDGEMLGRSAAEADGLLQRKLADLALVLGEYTAFLRDNGLMDESGYLSLLPAAMQSLKGANVVFFAFPSFTRQAAEGVRAAIGVAANVTGIFVDGDAAFCTHEGPETFRRVAREAGGCAERVVAGGMQEEAETLYGALFAPEKFARAPKKSQRFHVFEAEDAAGELQTVAALIKRYVAEGLRYRDIAVLVPDASYFLTAEKAFSAYKIPYFADRKRPFSEHPFCAFVLSVLDAVSDGALPQSADAVAASVYFGEGADEYRNYLLRFGNYRGAVRRDIKESAAAERFRRETLCACRERMLRFLGAFPRKGTGEAFVRGVLALEEATDAAAVTETLASHFSGSEREFLDLTPLDGVLREIVAVAGGETFTAREFGELLAGGLSALEIAMIPQSADAVFLGDATESKFSRVRVLFAAGMTDALPVVSRDTAVITDRDIARLGELSVEIEPAIAVVNARARESLCNNLCSFRGALYLSRPLRAGDGETGVSEALAYAKSALISAPMPAIYPYSCSEETPALLELLRLRTAPEGSENAKKFAALRGALCEMLGAARVGDLLSGGSKEAVPEAAELYFSGDVSPTLLETYFSCPYAGFLARGLRAREREERAVQDTDAGVFVHAVLERVAPAFNSLADEAACRAMARSAAEELLKDARFSALADTPAGVYTGSRLAEESEEVTAAAYRQLTGSGFRVRETEGNVVLPDLNVRGRADRVDEGGGYVRVVDYKTGAIDDKPTSYYTGRKLQLQLYLLAAAQGEKAAGAFYFPAAESFAAEGEEKYRMKGFFSKDSEVLSLMDKTLAEGEKSAYFEGGGRSEKAMPQEEFEAFLAYARLVSAKAEGEMKAGNVAPSPYEGVCDYCKYGGACGFAGTPRKERAIGCEEIADIVKKERGEA